MKPGWIQVNYQLRQLTGQGPAARLADTMRVKGRWEDDATQKKILTNIRRRYPGWGIEGWALAEMWHSKWLKECQLVQGSEKTPKGAFVHTLSLYHPSHAAPVGVVWFYLGAGGSVEVVWSYTQERFRERGIRTRLHQEMGRFFRIIVTRAATRHSLRWLRKNGFVRGPFYWTWKR